MVRGTYRFTALVLHHLARLTFCWGRANRKYFPRLLKHSGTLSKFRAYLKISRWSALTSIKSHGFEFDVAKRLCKVISRASGEDSLWSGQSFQQRVSSKKSLRNITLKETRSSWVLSRPFVEIEILFLLQQQCLRYHENLKRLQRRSNWMSTIGLRKCWKCPFLAYSCLT